MATNDVDEMLKGDCDSIIRNLLGHSVEQLTEICSKYSGWLDEWFGPIAELVHLED